MIETNIDKVNRSKWAHHRVSLCGEWLITYTSHLISSFGGNQDTIIGKCSIESVIIYTCLNVVPNCRMLTNGSDVIMRMVQELASLLWGLHGLSRSSARVTGGWCQAGTREGGLCTDPWPSSTDTQSQHSTHALPNEQLIHHDHCYQA